MMTVGTLPTTLGPRCVVPHGPTLLLIIRLTADFPPMPQVSITLLSATAEDFYSISFVGCGILAPGFDMDVRDDRAGSERGCTNSFS